MKCNMWDRGWIKLLGAPGRNKLPFPPVSLPQCYKAPDCGNLIKHMKPCSIKEAWIWNSRTFLIRTCSDNKAEATLRPFSCKRILSNSQWAVINEPGASWCSSLQQIIFVWSVMNNCANPALPLELFSGHEAGFHTCTTQQEVLCSHVHNSMKSSALFRREVAQPGAAGRGRKDVLIPPCWSHDFLDNTDTGVSCYR